MSAIWELSRMVRQKKREVDQTKEVEDLLDEIEEFVHEGVLTKREWKAFCLNVEEAIQKKECSPREAQAKVLDFLEALHSIAQEYGESEDGIYLSEPEEVDDVPKAHRHRIEGKRRNAGVFSPGHMLPNQPTYYPNAPQSFFTPGTASPFAAGVGGTSSPAFTYVGAGGPAGTASPNPSAFHAAGTASPPHPNYSGPLPVPPSHSFSQQSWGPLPVQVPGGPTSPVSTVPAQNTWTPNSTFPFPAFAANQNGNYSNGNSNRPSAPPSPPRSRNSPANNASTTPPGNASPGKAASNAGSSPIVPPSPNGSTSAHVSGWGDQNGSPFGFMSPTQEAQAQRAAAAKLREQARRQSQAEAIEEELGVPKMDLPPPPNAQAQQQQKPSVNWASGIEDGPKENGAHGGNPPPESVSEAGTYMEPAGEKNKRRRRKQ
ncbi:hypothetical protein SLS56_003690 [Neofusicoccum ribis]|uniref:Uncharacterized protein n=1 Tax=Neofusicoccum ribis TaxID=45134 RepID=A0ABR3SZG1_9PEZI